MLQAPETVQKKLLLGLPSGNPRIEFSRYLGDCLKRSVGVSRQLGNLGNLSKNQAKHERGQYGCVFLEENSIEC